MATLSATMPSLSDVVKATGPDGKILRIAELLEKMSHVMGFLPWQEGNLATGHRVSVRTSNPTPTKRRLNQRVLPTKATQEVNDEQCAILEDYSQVDKKVADLNGNTAAYRLSQAHAHMEGMVQEFERQAFYGNSAAVQEEFDGFIPRMTAAGDTVIDAGGSGSDNSSIVLACVSPTTIYGIYPRGGKGGIEHTDKGVVTSETSDGLMEVYRDHWSLTSGIAVEDPRWLGAIRAIDVSTLVADPTGATTNLFNLMIKLLHGVPKIDSPNVKPGLFMNRSLFQMLDVQAMNKTNVYLQVGGEEGNRKVTFRGIPIYVSDALTETESVI